MAWRYSNSGCLRLFGGVKESMAVLLCLIISCRVNRNLRSVLFACLCMYMKVGSEKHGGIDGLF